jgi:hypothetical protein
VDWGGWQLLSVELKIPLWIGGLATAFSRTENSTIQD